MGTPSRGSGATSMGQTISKAASICGRKPNKHLLQALERESGVLEIQRQGFVTIANQRDLRLCYIHEEIPTHIGMVRSKLSCGRRN